LDFLFNISPLVKLALIFVLIIVLIRQKLSLGAALTIGAIILGLWFHLSPFKVCISVIDSLTSIETIILFLVITLILVLSHSLETSGQMRRLLDSFGGISQNTRLNLVLFPAIIGLLPMPGGAVFSAPMVYEISKKENLSARRKTLINYWFRHIWEFFWPLYPGVILTCALSGIDMGTFILIQFPLTPFMACVGYFTLLRSVPVQKESASRPPAGDRRRFLLELIPILIVIGGAIIFGTVIYIIGNVWVPFKEVRKEIPLIIALITSVFWVWRYNRMTVMDIKAIFLNKSLLSMLFMIAGIMIFQGVLKDSHAVSEISQSLTSARVPVILVIVILPFLVGTVTGISVAFVGATFPIIFSLIADTPMAAQLHAYTVLAFCSGYLGVLLSPLHVCLVLTCEYFHTTLMQIYRRLLFPSAILAGGALLSFWINRLL